MNTYGKIIFLSFYYIIFFTGCAEEKDKIDFFLPEKFSGNVVLIFNCVTGIEPILKDNVKQIFVPQSGIVKIKQKIKFGIIDYNYFILQKNKYLKLNVFSSFENHLNNEFYVGPGSVLTVNDNLKNTVKQQYAFIFYVHKSKEEFLDNYSDEWILDTLQKQTFYE